MSEEPKNKERKFKWHSIYGQILFDRRLTEAWKQVKANKGAGGIDGVTIEEYEKNLEGNLENLLGKLRAKQYRPQPVRREYIPKKNGKLRPLGIPNLEDRIVQQAIVNVLQPKFEEEVFHRWSVGYRPGKGAQNALQLIMWNIEDGYNHIYDADIKGFFDNIPHKKLMRVLNKYISDGTVLDMIWKWLKAGYMEEGKFHEVESGTPQGGVISPLLANIYLNELDWELHQNKIRFVRYADDFLLFATTKEDILRAEQITKAKLEELGLELAEEKTRFVDFDDDDFDFLGYTFVHWRKRKKDGTPYYMAKPTDESWADFRRKIKEKTSKKLTLNTQEWLNRVNPVIRGKVNYFQNLYRAVQALAEFGRQTKCVINVFENELKAIDGYIRRRLRVAMLHKSPSQRKGWLMCSKWTNEFFVKVGLVPAHWLYYHEQKGWLLTEYIEYLKACGKRHLANKIQRYKRNGQEYYTPDRLRKIRAAQTHVTAY